MTPNDQQPAITIRPGRLSDAGQEAALNNSVDWCYDEAQTLAEYHDDAYEPSSVLVAEAGDEIAGKLELFIGWKSTHGRFGVIRRFIVKEEYRSRGVGRQLLDAATGWAREQGCSFIELSVDVTNPIAHAFYKREGFDEDRVEVMLRKSLDGRPHASLYDAHYAEWFRQEG